MASTFSIDVGELVRLGATGVVSVVGFLLAQAYKKFARDWEAHGKALEDLKTRVAILEDRGAHAEHS